MRQAPTEVWLGIGIMIGVLACGFPIIGAEGRRTTVRSAGDRLACCLNFILFKSIVREP